MTKPYYITTPIYYVNAKPHIGTAYTSVAADTLARFMRLDGREVLFVTGTDEHGQKVEATAKKLGLEPQEYTDQIAREFEKLGALFGLTYDDFVRTTQARHKKTACALWQKLVDAGQIYEDTYKGWYSIRDEAFYRDEDLVEGKAPTGAEVTWVEEPSFFFRLSNWRDKLIAFYEKNPEAVRPYYRYNEVMSFLKGEVHDLCVSRTSFKWGVPVPGHEEHVMYVWVDALPNYLTVLGYPDDLEGYNKFWPHAHHIIGKDILRFHAVYWPAMLMAAGLEPPQQIFAHGWWTREGQKISKSLGNVIDPFEIVEQYGSDQIRYFLLREVKFGRDADFSKEALERRINSDLANDYGNLAQRVLSFVFKHCHGKLPQKGVLTQDDEALLEVARTTPERMRTAADHNDLQGMCEEVWKIISHANRYVDAQAPWALRKTDPQRMETVLYVLADCLRHIGVLSQAIVPKAAENLLNILDIPQETRTLRALQDPLESHNGSGQVQSPDPLFPRVA